MYYVEGQVASSFISEIYYFYCAIFSMASTWHVSMVASRRHSMWFLACQLPGQMFCSGRCYRVCDTAGFSDCACKYGLCCQGLHRMSGMMVVNCLHTVLCLLSFQHLSYLI